MAEELDPPDESYPCYCCPVMVDRANHLSNAAFREAQQHCVKVTFNSVTLADIYKALQQGLKAVPKLIAKRIAICSASGKVTLVQPEDMTAPIVVMNSSASVVDSEDELSRLMVLILPAKVMIQVTETPRLFDADESTPEWLLHDLRLDVVLFVH